MHELSLARALLEAVQEEAARRGGGNARRAGIRVGAISGVDSEALRFAFEALVADGEDGPLVLEIETVPWRQRCPRCAAEFEVAEMEVACPGCGEPRTDFAGGDELTLAWVVFADDSG